VSNQQECYRETVEVAREQRSNFEGNNLQGVHSDTRPHLKNEIGVYTLKPSPFLFGGWVGRFKFSWFRIERDGF